MSNEKYTRIGMPVVIDAPPPPETPLKIDWTLPPDKEAIAQEIEVRAHVAGASAPWGSADTSEVKKDGSRKTAAHVCPDMRTSSTVSVVTAG